MKAPPPYPSHLDHEVVDKFFVQGRNLWPDLADIGKTGFEKEKFTEPVIRFLKSTCLNEFGTVHYTQGYFDNYGADYKLGIWSMMWGGEEYLHYIVLRRILQAIGHDIDPHMFEGVERSEYRERYNAYLEEYRVDPRLDMRLVQAIYGVVQEYSAVIAYTSVGEAVGDPEFLKLMKRMARDEMRHCRFNQLSVEALVERGGPEVRALVWDQFNAFYKDHRMPQEFIDMYDEEGDFGTELYTSFWTPKFRSKLILFHTHFFGQFRSPAPAGN